MAEVFFILITVYVVYVVHTVVTCNQRKKAESIAAKPQISVAERSEKKEQIKPDIKPIAEQKKTVATKANKTVPAKAKTKLPSGSLRNPETGEVAKIANNYRMTRRWIKEALVTEGLLKKVYKTNEVDDAAKVKINKALEKLKAMDKYQ